MNNDSEKFFFYRVRKSDTIVSVANKFRRCVFDVIDDNRLEREITVGDVIMIRREDCETYKVKPLDDVAIISEKYNENRDSILMKNGGIPYVFYGLIIRV